MTGRNQFLDERTVRGEIGRSLRHRVLLLFHRREIDDLVGDLAIYDLAVRRFDKAVLIDAGEGRQRVDQTDVRAFRRFDRTDTTIVRRVNVADFEACAFAGKTARAERRHAALVGDFRQRVGLVHELRKLARTEELAHGGHGRLRIDQVVRHDGRNIDAAHALLDGTLHAQKANAILVFQQLAHRTHAAVAEIVDVVDVALAVLEVDQFLDHGQDVFLAQRGHGVFGVQLETHVQLHAANGRQIVTLTIEEQAFEQSFCSFLGRRFAWTHDLVDRLQTFVTIFGLVDLERVAHPRAGADVIDVQQIHRVDAGSIKNFEVFCRNFVARFNVDATGLFVDHVTRCIMTEDFLGWQQQRFETVLGSLVGRTRTDLLTGGEHFFARLRIDQRESRLLATPLLGDERNVPAFALLARRPLPSDGVVEVRENVFVI